MEENVELIDYDFRKDHSLGTLIPENGHCDASSVQSLQILKLIDQTGSRSHVKKHASDEIENFAKFSRLLAKP